MDFLGQPEDQAVFDKWDNVLTINSSTNTSYRDFDASLEIEETLPSRTLNNIFDAHSSNTRSPPPQRAGAAPLPLIDIAGSKSRPAGNWESLEQFDSLERDELHQHSGFHPPRPTEPMDILLERLDTCHTLSEEPPSDPELRMPPKIGRRFSSRPSKILKAWLADHTHRPYPSIRDIEIMQRQTSLSRQQILTWFTNARRRLKVQARRPPTPTPFPLQMESAIQTLKLDEQNLSLEEMNPLQRWQHSPPEHEPAAASAIAKAVSGLSTSNNSIGISMDDMSLLNSWLDDSSASSAFTSQSSNSSIDSTWSAGYQRPGDVFDRRKINKRKRRRAPTNRQEGDRCNPLKTICQIYQCTFCTETFKTKHNWQRHEKSWHLSLEQWVCSPQGPTFPNLEKQLTCTYCGLINPNHDHIMEHNYAACHNRNIEERTFYRKDHLQQHLKLVHNAKFMKWPMEQWKSEIQNLQSQCGFCGLIIDSWIDRSSHLAHHFREGRTMADWKGDWGFDSHVLDMVENAMPPYLIHYERNSPWPFTTQQGPVETPVSAFELLKLELDFWVNNTNPRPSLPTNQELQYESCCIILGSEMLSNYSGEPGPSWLRDLLMSSEDIVKQARIHPMRSSLKARITQLKIHGKGNIFENCGLESRLRKFVDPSASSGYTIGSSELQLEASNIIASLEALSPKPSAIFVPFLNNLIFESAHWLAPFCSRAQLDIHNSLPAPVTMLRCHNTRELEVKPVRTESGHETTSSMTDITGSLDSIAGKTALYVQDDSNCYRRLTRELSRFVASTISPRNPNRHIPTDEELQHQARWIMFEDDDPWNQTPADNPHWLSNFKKIMGLNVSTLD